MMFIRIIFLFRKIFWSTNKSIRFAADFSEVIHHFKVKMRQKFILISLTMTEFFNNNKIFQILVIYNHINEKNYVF